MTIVHEASDAHRCSPPPACWHASGTIWRCDCGRGWFRNDIQYSYVAVDLDLWSRVFPWHFRKRRLLRQWEKAQR